MASKKLTLGELFSQVLSDVLSDDPVGELKKTGDFCRAEVRDGVRPERSLRRALPPPADSGSADVEEAQRVTLIDGDDEYEVGEYE